MRVMIAGGTGFLGRHVAEALVATGHTVLLLARGTHPLARPTGWRSCRPMSAPARAARSDARLRCAGQPDRHQARARDADLRAGPRRRHAPSDRSRPGTWHSPLRSRQRRLQPARPEGAYHDTKWRAEELVRSGGLEYTILKPGVIYGPGDDMVTHLVKMIRFAPVFPVVGRGDSLLQPVDARDVAAAVVGALANDRSIGKSYDVVGPERLTLRAVVETVARGVGLRVWIVGTPIWFQRVAVGLMNTLSRIRCRRPRSCRC